MFKINLKTKSLLILVTILDPVSPQRLALGFEGRIAVEVYAMPKRKITWSFAKTATDAKAIVAELGNDGKMIVGADKYEITSRGVLVIKKVSEGDGGSYQVSSKGDGAVEAKTIEVIVGCK